MAIPVIISVVGRWVCMQAHKRGSNAPIERLANVYVGVFPGPVTRGRTSTIFKTVSDTHCMPPHNVKRALISKPTICPSLVAAITAISEHVHRGQVYPRVICIQM